MLGFFLAVEFNLPDGKQINLPIAAAEADLGSALIYSPQLKKAQALQGTQTSLLPLTRLQKERGRVGVL